MRRSNESCQPGDVSFFYVADAAEVSVDPKLAGEAPVSKFTQQLFLQLPRRPRTRPRDNAELTWGNLDWAN